MSGTRRHRIDTAVRVAVRGGLAVGVAALAWAGVGAAGATLSAPSDPGRAAATEQGAAPLPQAPTGQDDLAGLTPSMARAVSLAVEAATRDGVTLTVTSAHRTEAHQERLFAEAVEKYGSEADARRWVLPPGESEHVTGRAVDVGPAAGAAWLEENGVRFGLCRRYDNEPWHFERLAGELGSRCPARQATAAG